jgi:ABC-type transporter Mla subunit MlaD
MVVKAYFGSAMNLRVGADVRLAGVEIGHVQGVRARPELKEAPAEVVMLLPANGLNIPSDSTASLETAGGRTYVDIDVRHTSGAPIGSNAVLRTVATRLN